MHWASDFTSDFRGRISVFAFASALARRFLCGVSFAHKVFSVAWILSRPCMCHETTRKPKVDGSSMW